MRCRMVSGEGAHKSTIAYGDPRIIYIDPTESSFNGDKIYVYVDGQKEDKAGQSFPDTAVIEVRGTTLKYVSRGGLKLEKAMQNFDVTLEGKICMDVGSSTGGFTDCMLQNGAVKVYAVDFKSAALAFFET